jgi:hypothetical protein
VDDCRVGAGLGLISLDWQAVGRVLGWHGIAMTGALHLALRCCVDEQLTLEGERSKKTQEANASAQPARSQRVRRLPRRGGARSF